MVSSTPAGFLLAKGSPNTRRRPGRDRTGLSQESQGPRGKQMEPAVPVEVAVGGGLVGLLELILQAQTTDQSGGGGDVVQVPVGALFDGEPLDPVGLDIPTGPVRGLQNHHLQPTREPRRPDPSDGGPW